MSNSKLRFAAIAVVTALTAASAMAISPFRAKPGEEKFNEVQLLLTSPARNSGAIHSVPASDLSGKYYAQWDALDTGLKRKGFTGMPKLSIADDGTAYLDNFGNEECSLKGSYDAATSTLTFPAQAAWTEDPYGTFTFCYFDAEQRGFSTKRNVTFTLQSDGTLKANSGWCFIITDAASTFYGSATAVSLDCSLTPSNATMSGEVLQSDGSWANGSYPVYVAQTMPDELLVANFTNNGTDVRVRLTTTKTASIEPQMILYNALVGPYCIYGTNWSATKPAGSGAVSGDIIDNTMIEFGQWGVFRSNLLSTTTGGMKTSMLTMNAGSTFTIPTASTPQFEGSGTASEPYKISSTSDMFNLALSVNGGNNYKDKYFVLTTDLDYTSSGYRIIGVDKTFYFDGTFDGGGHTITGVKLERGAADYTGLFGYAGANSVIKNIVIRNGYLLTFGKYSGFIAGYTLGKINGCDVTGNLNTTADYAGGIAGYGVEFTNCQFTGNMSTAAQAGGIAGQITKGTVSGCSVRAAISSSVLSSSITHAVGGVVGQTSASSTDSTWVKECSFIGSLYDRSGYAHLGGIAGSLARYISVRNCSAMGLISTVVKSNSTGSCGGVVGYNSEGIVENCLAGNLITGSVASNKTGGICGIVSKLTSGAGTLRHNIFTGQISIAGALAPEASIYGKIETTCIAEDNWYDAQMAGISPEGNALATSTLTSGQLPGELQASAWSTTAGSYPYPAGAPVEMKAISTVAMHLSGKDNAKNVKTAFTVDSAEGVNWYIYDGQNYVTETSALKLDGNTVTLKGEMETAYMVARTTLGANTFFKLITLQLAPAQFEGAGTEDSPFLIKSIDDIRKLNDAIITYGQTFEGDYFALANDIDMTDVGTSFTGIADYGKTKSMFNGTFDGKGKSIRNWKVNGLVLDDAGKADTKLSLATIALFSQIGPKGVVKNITIDSSCSLSGYAGVAGIAALSYGTVENCRNYADITISNYYTAGIVARMMNGARTVKCYNAGTITSGYGYAGGIAAQIMKNTLVDECMNAGKVQVIKVTESYGETDTKFAGGVVCVNDTNSLISNCLNAGDVTSYAHTGGIVAGFSTLANASGCVNTGLVLHRGPNYGGAIAGQTYNSATASNLYYDKQILTLGACNGVEVEGMSGCSTSQLTSGEALEGLDAAKWQYDAGMYPTLKAFASEAAANAYRRMTVTLQLGETVTEMTSPATLGTSDGLKWTLPDGTTTFSLAGNKLSVGAIDGPVSVTLTANLGVYSRSFSLQGINNPFDGEGSATAPYKIATPTDLLTLSKYTTEFGVRYENKHFALINDIDMSSVALFTPISCGDNAEFRATFEGNNHSIKNLTISATGDAGYYMAFIANLGTQGTVRHLNLEGGSIKGSRYVGSIAGNCRGSIEFCSNSAGVETVGDGTTNNFAGGIAGYIENGGSIYRCDNYGKIYSSYTYAGGIAASGTSKAKISYCRNFGQIATNEGRNYAGGIVGGGNIMLDSCVNYGKICGNSYIGGIGGSLGASDQPVLNCVNKGTIEAKSSYTGGIAGTATTELRNCVNYSDIQGTAYAGGIAGSLNKAAYDCVNYGSIRTTGNYTGGVIGYGSGALIGRCINYGDSVITTGNTAGGIVGTSTTNQASVDSCVNYSHVASTGATAYQIGGITGSCSSKVNDCINFGNISSESYSTAGISGGGTGSGYRNINFGNVSTIFNVATTAKGNAAGIWGDSGNTISDCINYGNVTAIRYTGGIAGRPSSSSKILNCYFSGTLTTQDAATSGAVINKETSMTKVTVTNCYYNSDLNADLKQSALAAEVAIAKTALELRNAELGEAFDYHVAAMPTLKAHAGVAEANCRAAMIVFADSESEGNFKTYATIPMLPGLEWTSTSNIKIKAEESRIAARAETTNETGSLYLKGGRFNRTFTLVLTNPSGASSTTGDKEVVSTTIYSLSGVELRKIPTGEIVIEKTIYSDGTVSVRRVMIRK